MTTTLIPSHERCAFPPWGATCTSSWLVVHPTSTSTPGLASISSRRAGAASVPTARSAGSTAPTVARSSSSNDTRIAVEAAVGGVAHDRRAIRSHRARALVVARLRPRLRVRDPGAHGPVAGSAPMPAPGCGGIDHRSRSSAPSRCRPTSGSTLVASARDSRPTWWSRSSTDSGSHGRLRERRGRPVRWGQAPTDAGWMMDVEHDARSPARDRRTAGRDELDHAKRGGSETASPCTTSSIRATANRPRAGLVAVTVIAGRAATGRIADQVRLRRRHDGAAAVIDDARGDRAARDELGHVVHAHRRRAVPPMSPQFWWYTAARAGSWRGASRPLRWSGVCCCRAGSPASPKPAWVLDLHRFLGAAHGRLRRSPCARHLARLVRALRTGRDLRAVRFHLEAGRGRLGCRRRVPAHRDRGDLAAPAPDPPPPVACGAPHQLRPLRPRHRPCPHRGLRLG